MGKWLCIIAVLLLALPGCGTDETPPRLNTFTPLTSIVITSAVVSLPAGVSTQLTATGNFSGLFTRDITNEVTWSTDQPGLVDFPNDFPLGRVRAITVGPATATITATTTEGITGSFNLTVNTATITALTIAPLLPSRPKGLTQAFTAQGSFSDTTTFDLTKDVTWASSDETVATINDEFVGKGKATALEIGTTYISAQFDIFAPTSTMLTVTAASLSSIAVTPINPALLSLSTKAFSATGTYSDKTTGDITADVTWTSSDPAVATATGNIIKSLTPGLSAIKATLGTVSGTSNLTVTGGSLQSIALTFAQAVNGVLINGTSSRVTARGTFSNGTSRDITGAVTLTDDSANVSVTPVSGNLALVNALAVTSSGSPAKVSATYGSTVAPGESLLTVTAPTLVNIAISPTSLTLASGTSGQLSLTGTFFSGNQDLTPTVTWSSADPAIATVGTDGRVHAATPGITVVTATYNYGGQTTDTTSVEVVARTLQSLTISAVTTPATIVAGTEKEFKVTAHYTDSIEQDVTEDALWTIDDVNVAKFSDQLADPGLVVAVDAGTATLTAKFGGMEDTETLVIQ